MPDRWLPEIQRQEGFRHIPTAFAPFESALFNFNCASKPCALLEMRKFVTTILHEFEFKPAPQYDAEACLDGLRSTGMIRLKSLPLVVERRHVRG